MCTVPKKISDPCIYHSIYKQHWTSFKEVAESIPEYSNTKSHRGVVPRVMCFKPCGTTNHQKSSLTKQKWSFKLENHLKVSDLLLYVKKTVLMVHTSSFQEKLHNWKIHVYGWRNSSNFCDCSSVPISRPIIQADSDKAPIFWIQHSKKNK